MKGLNASYVNQLNQFLYMKYESHDQVEPYRYKQNDVLNYEDKCMTACCICEMSVNKIAEEFRPEMQILIKTIDDKILTIQIEHSNKIRDVKMKIQEKCELCAYQQNLFFQGEILDDDDKTIDEYGICEKSVIDIVARLRGGMQIFVQVKNGKIISLEVQNSDKIIDIKYKIQEKLGLQPDEQILKFKGEIFDDDNKTIYEYQIYEKSVINVVEKLSGKIQIFVITMNGNTVTIEVKKSDKIIDLKYKIQEKLELHPDQQILVCQGKVLDDDDKTIDECQICEISIINVFDNSRDKIQIFAKTTDESKVKIEVKKSDKIIDLKYKIQEKLGLHPDEQKLLYKNEKLNDNNKTIDEYKLSDQSLVQVVNILKNGMKIFFNTIDGKTFLCEFQKSNKIIDIKYKIKYKTGVHLDEQILIYQNEILNDDKTIDEYQIQGNAVINFVNRPKNEIQIFIKISNKSIIPISIVKSSKIIDLKTKVEEQTGMQFVGNNLVYDNKILHNDKLLIDYQIGDGCVILVHADSRFFIFLQAIKSGSLESVKDLYDIEFKKETYSASPMHYACKQHNVDIVKFLIEKEFNINSIDIGLKKPIHYASINGCVKVLETLIKNNCSFEECDSYGMKPIHFACLNGNLQNVNLLIEKECNLESQDYSSSRPIHLACLSGNIEIVKVLLQNKCRVDVLDKSNKSPINIAEKENRTDIVEILNEEVSRITIKKMIADLNLKCDGKCEHKFCSFTLEARTFDIGSKIKRGGYGDVYKCNLPRNSDQIAIKQIPADGFNSKSIEGNINSFLFLKKLNHERIIKYFGAITKQENIFIFMELMPGGSLRSKITTNQPMIPGKVIHYTIQILEGLQFLHGNKIIHRDIKPDNILLDDDGNVKLTDLGLGLLLCRTVEDTTKHAITFCGTPYYMAPEIINGEEYSYGADIWALGVTVMEMATGKLPYPELSVPQTVMFRIATTKVIPYQLPESSPNKIKQIIDQMLNPVPSKRPSAMVVISNLKTM